MKKIILLFLLILAFGLRLYRLDNPIADWHSWRQADTSAVSRNFIKKGFNLVEPRFDDLSNISSGLDNPEGYRFVEFPAYNFFQASAYRFFPYFSLEVWGRLVSIVFSLVSLVFLYLITKKYLDETTALWAAFFFAVLPFNIYYSRTILPEPMMVMTSLGMIYFFSQKKVALAIFFAAVSFLLKPYTLVFILPMIYLVWRQYRFKWRRWIVFSLLVIVSLIPFLVWRWWMKAYPEGIPAYDWLFNKNNIRFKGAFFWWLFGERIAKLILGGWGIFLLGLGLIIKPLKKEGLFFYSWLAAILAYFVIIAGGNIQHDYYQVIAIPIICVFLAKAANFLLTGSKELFSQLSSRLLLVTSIIFMLAFSWYQVRDFFNINNWSIVKAGAAANRLLPDDAKVIAPYGGDTAFLYQTNRQGWPIGFEIEDKIKSGATHYININFDDETNELIKKHCPIEKTSDWVIIDLQTKCP